MLKVYPAIIHNEEGFWVEFPDLEGCHTCGNTLEETMELASEALGLYLVSLIENNQEIPTASKLDDIKADSDSIVNYIVTDVNKYRRNTKAVKKTLSIPQWLSDEAEANNLSLSKLLQEAIKTQLNLK